MVSGKIGTILFQPINLVSKVSGICHICSGGNYATHYPGRRGLVRNPILPSCLRGTSGGDSITEYDPECHDSTRRYSRGIRLDFVLHIYSTPESGITADINSVPHAPIFLHLRLSMGNGTPLNSIHTTAYIVDKK